MSNKSNNIDLMNRDALVNLAEKLKIKGYTNKYKNPYLSKEKIKKKILEEVGVVKTFNKSHSQKETPEPGIPSPQNSKPSRV